MSICLAATWHPRGELSRFERLLPDLKRLYPYIVIAFPPEADSQALEPFRWSEFHDAPEIKALQTNDWSWGRYVALKSALQTPTSHIHYADMDRLLRWLETRPKEHRRALQALEKADYLLMGRSQAAYQTHPQAMIRTEAISNLVISRLIGQAVDVSAGSKGFCRSAAAFLIENTRPGRAIGTDGEWTVLLHRAGFRIEYMEVDGLDWESADRYRPRAVSAEEQRAAAKAYDADPENWAARAAIAMEIVQSGLDAATRDISEIPTLNLREAQSEDLLQSLREKRAS